MVVFGSGGHGKVVLDILISAGEKVAGYIDEDKKKWGQEILGHKVLGGWDQLKGLEGCSVVLGIGNNSVRARIFKQIEELGLSIASAVHPRAIVARSVRSGKGVVIMPGAVVNADAVLGDGVVVNTGATVDHDCDLGDFCQIWPGAHLAGTVKVGKTSYVGTGAAVIQNINIGENVMIGAGAVVVADIPNNVTAVGSPARMIKERK